MAEACLEVEETPVQQGSKLSGAKVYKTSLLPGRNNGFVHIKFSFCQAPRHSDCWIPRFLDHQGEDYLNFIFIKKTNTIFLTNICNI